MNFFVRKVICTLYSVALLAADLMVWDHQRQNIIWTVAPFLVVGLWSFFDNGKLKPLVSRFYNIFH